MALFLVQHGKSLPKDKDPEQSLSTDPVGRKFQGPVPHNP